MGTMKLGEVLCWVQGVPTEREVHTMEDKAPVYRVLLSALKQPS